jgi:hypothetical protein
MSLEEALNANTKAVLELTAALLAKPQQPILAADEVSPGTVEKFAAAALEHPNVHPSEMPPQITSPTSEPTETESAPVTYDDVKKVTIAVSKISKDKAVAGLAHFGVTSAKQLIESQWLTYVAHMTAILGE